MCPVPASMTYVTPMQYVHFMPRHDDADRLTRAFAEGTAAEVHEIVTAEAA
jgi:hypothetical protein